MSAHHRPWPRRHPIWSAVIAAVAILVALAGWAGWRTWSMVQNLQDLAELASSLSSAQVSDQSALRATLDQAGGYARAADSAAGSWGTAAATLLPGVGHDIAAARTLSGVAADLVQSATAVATTLPTVVRDGGGFNTAALSGLSDAVTALDTTLHSASARLAQIDTAALQTSLAGKLGTVTRAVDSAMATTSTLQPFVKALPTLAGSGGERTWLVLTQNLAEARPSGGFAGAYLVIHASNGTLTVTGSGDNNEFGDTDMPTSTWPKALVDTWGTAYLSNFAGFNVAAHYPYNAQALAATWVSKFHTPVDGVILFGQGITQYLAAASGPVTVGSTTIQPGDLAEYLTTGVYRDYPDPAKKDAVVAQIVGDVFSRLATGKFDLSSLIAAGSGGGTADQLLLWSSHADDEAAFTSAGLDGQLPDGDGSTTSVRLYNQGHNKLDAFTHLSVDYSRGSCTAQTDPATAARSSTLTATIRNETKPAGLPAYVLGERLTDGAGATLPVGSNEWYAVLYVPSGSDVTRVTVDGKAVASIAGEERGHPFVLVDVTAAPGEAATVEVSFTEPTTDDSGYPLETAPTVLLPPLVNAASVSTTAGVDCQ